MLRRPAQALWLLAVCAAGLVLGTAPSFAAPPGGLPPQAAAAGGIGNRAVAAPGHGNRAVIPSPPVPERRPKPLTVLGRRGPSAR